jgi:hypothetical protein
VLITMAAKNSGVGKTGFFSDTVTRMATATDTAARPQPRASLV